MTLPDIHRMSLSVRTITIPFTDLTVVAMLRIAGRVSDPPLQFVIYYREVL